MLRKDDSGPSMGEHTEQAAANHMDKVIYTFWTGSNAMSSDRQRCFESIVKNSGCDVVLVTQSNLNDFILSDEPLHEGYQYLSETHKADYLRCYFLHHFGGGYADIKQTDFDWSPWFDKFDDPTIWAVGYQEVGPTGVAYGAKDRSRLTAEFEKLIGNGAYIFRRNTELTRRWYEELKQRMDIFLPELKRYPSRHPRDELNRNSSNVLFRTLGVGRSKYPITWSGILADIFHPLVYEFTDRIDKTLPLQKWRTAAEAYTLAQKAFSEGRYDKARRYAAQAELLISEDVGVTRVGVQPASPIASVIIVIHRQSQEAEKALYRLAKLSNKYEIIIVDNGCGLDPNIIGKCLATFVILRVDFNYGCCGGRNVGARFSNSAAISSLRSVSVWKSAGFSCSLTWWLPAASSRASRIHVAWISGCCCSSRRTMRSAIATASWTALRSATMPFKLPVRTCSASSYAVVTPPTSCAAAWGPCCSRLR